VEKSRSGSETRQRTEGLNLRLLPSEQRALRVLADQAGHRSVQAWILEALGPHLERVSR
jgi:predicted HicB family RNase H-like nuclease